MCCHLIAKTSVVLSKLPLYLVKFTEKNRDWKLETNRDWKLQWDDDSLFDPGDVGKN